MQAGGEALYMSATEGEAAAVQTLLEIFMSHRKPRDVSEARQVELKRWSSIWAYIMDGRRLFVGTVGQDQPPDRQGIMMVRAMPVVRLLCRSADWLMWCDVMQGGGGLGGKTQSLAHMWGQVQESDGEADTVLNPLNDESNSWAAFIDVSDCAFLWCYLQG